jgi:CBS domain-containing protein
MEHLTAKDIMKGEVLTVKTDWSIEQLGEFMIENSISGAPVLSHDGRLTGVVSLTDIVRHASIPGKDLKATETHDFYLDSLNLQFAREEIRAYHLEAEPLATVKDIMTPMIFDVTEDTSLKEVADAMIRGQIHRVFVTRDEKLIGIITSLDMLTVIRDIY